MEYRRVGDTGIMISEIGFGCGNTAGLMIWGEPEDRVRAAEHAMDLGINYFDTAATYGDGKSEENLGPVLAKLSKKPLVGSKVALQEDELDDIPGAVRKSVERSLRRLGVDCLDLVHLHNRTIMKREPGKTLAIGALLSVEDLLGPRGIQEAFETLQKEGKLRHFGYCAFGGEAPAYNQVADEGRFKSVLTSYSILNPSAGRRMPGDFPHVDYDGIIDRAASRGIGVVALRVLDAGALSGNPQPHDLSRGGPSRDPEYAKNAHRAKALEFLKRDPTESLAQVGIRFALNKPGISTVLVGFSELSQVDEAAACSGKEGISADQLAKLDELYQTDFGLAEAGTPR